jgi:hypothetical protein
VDDVETVQQYPSSLAELWLPNSHSGSPLTQDVFSAAIEKMKNGYTVFEYSAPNPPGPKPEGVVSKADMLIALNAAKARIKRHGWTRGWGDPSSGICIGSALGVGPLGVKGGKLELPAGPEALAYVVLPIIGQDYIRWNDQTCEGREDVFRVLDLAIKTIHDELLAVNA